MNGLDYMIIAVIALGAIHGSSRGILRIVSSLVALVAGIYLASVYHRAFAGYLAQAFSIRPEVAMVIAYIAILLAVMVIVAWVGSKLAALIRAVHLSWADRLAGALLGAAFGGLLAGLIV